MGTGSLRALVLSAGLGTRLRPLTDALPKPLLPVRGEPILAHTLAQLAQIREFGCDGAAINLHYRGELIRRHFGECYGDLPLTYSQEPDLLGTAGALYPLRKFFAGADLVLLINGDSLCRWPLEQLLRTHREAPAGTVATLLLSRGADPRAFGGGVGVSPGKEILSFRPGDPERGLVSRRQVFAGAQVFAPDLVAGLRPGPADIVRDIYMPRLAAGARLGSLTTARPWHDLGTPRRFVEATLDGIAAFGPAGWVAAEAQIAASAEVVHCSVEGGAQIGAGARVERSVLLPGTRAGEGSGVEDCLLGYGAEVPAGAQISRQLVTRGEDGMMVFTELGG